MNQGVTGDCAHVRRMLQELHDDGGLPSADIRRHLQGCPDCAAFEELLRGLSADLRDALDAAASSLPAPDYERVFSGPVLHHPRERRFSSRQIALAAVAAAAVAAAVPASILTISALRERSSMQETMTVFVEGLFRSPAVERADSQNQALDSLLNDLAENE